MSDLYLSASKIKTAQMCSWKYWCSYELKLPQSSNDGASRGWICHLIFELLGNPRHKKHYNKIIKSGSIFSSIAIGKLVLYHARKLDVDSEENLQLIDVMTVKGLLYDFFGKNKSKPSKAISEEAFNIQVNESGKKYNIRGFIDKLFIYDRGRKALIRDFKTSKQIFKGKEVTDNLQNLMYILAVNKLYPSVKEFEVEFLFLKFDLDEDLLGNPGKGVLKMDRVSAEELSGFEYQLTSIQEYLENFTEEDAKSNFAGSQDYPSDKTFGGPLMCGKDGFKKSRGEYVLDSNGEKIPSYICEFKNPSVYYTVSDSDNNFLFNCTLDTDSRIKSNHIVEKKYYKGCPYFVESSSLLV
jgi:hypothetical protein